MDGFPSLILIYRVFLLLAVWSCYMGMHSYLLLLLFRMLWSILYTRRRASPPTLHMSTCKNISHIQALASNFFPTPPIKLKLGLQANTWETTNSSNPLGPIKPSSQLGFPVVEFDWWTSSKISNAGSHTEHWWRCSLIWVHGQTCWFGRYQVFLLYTGGLLLILVWVCMYVLFIINESCGFFCPFEKSQGKSLIDWQEVQIQLACLFAVNVSQGGQILIPIWILEFCLSEAKPHIEWSPLPLAVSNWR